MTTKNIVSELADKWLPMPWERFFTPQRAADMWFSDELPPTVQDMVLSPLVTQSKWMLQHTINQQLAEGMRRQAALNEQRRLKALASRVGKRRKTKRH
jgi:hypothetical protein